MSERMGKTTSQITNAPKGAIFLWLDARTLHIPKLMAKQLGRGDLKVMAVSRFVKECRGIQAPLVIDHYATEHCSSRDWEVINLYLNRERARNSGELLARGI